MKLTKAKLIQIIKEELNEIDLPTYEGEPFGEYDLEAENEKGRWLEDPLFEQLGAVVKDLLQLGVSLGMDKDTIRRDIYEAVQHDIE